MTPHSCAYAHKAYPLHELKVAQSAAMDLDEDVRCDDCQQLLACRMVHRGYHPAHWILEPVIRACLCTLALITGVVGLKECRSCPLKRGLTAQMLGSWWAAGV